MKIASADSRRSRRRAGFTLAETIVASFILVVGLLAIFNLVHRLMQSAHWSTRTTIATELAQECMERIAGAGYQRAGSGSDVVGMFRRTWTVSAGANNRRTTEVRVDWMYPAGKTNAVVMRSMLSDPTPSSGGISFTNFPQGLF